MRTTIFAAILLICVSCKQNNSVSETPVNNSKNDTLIALEKLKSQDSTLIEFYKSIMESDKGQIPMELIDETIKMNQDFVFLYPNHEYAPQALDKIHQLYMQLGKYTFSTDYGVQLIENHPNYKNSIDVAYSIATTFDFMLNDQEKAIYYYNWLIENNKTPETLKKEISSRLKQFKNN